MIEYIKFILVASVSSFTFCIYSTSSALAKLSKAGTSLGGSSKQKPAEKKETPQERLKRIMNKQLTQQSKILSAVMFFCIQVYSCLMVDGSYVYS